MYAGCCFVFDLEASTLLGRRRARRAWAKYYSVKKFSFGAYEFSSFSLEYWAADLRMSSSVVRLVVLRVESAGVAQMDEVGGGRGRKGLSLLGFSPGRIDLYILGNRDYRGTAHSRC